MKFLLLIFTSVIAQFGFGQDSSQLKLTHLALDIGGEILHHGSQTNNHFSNIVKDKSVLIHQDSAMNYNGHYGSYDYFTSGINVGLKRESSKFRFVVGLTIDGRSDRRYLYSKEEEFRVDTIHQIASNGIDIDTLFKDSIVNHSLTYSLQSRQLFGRYEALYDMGRNNFTFSCGLGLMAGYSIGNTAISRYSSRYENHIKDSDNQYLYSIEQGYTFNSSSFFSPQISSIGYQTSAVYRRVIIKPYLPLYLEIRFGSGKVAKHMAMAYNGRAGAEFQITLHDGINPRFFHAHNLVFIYKI